MNLPCRILVAGLALLAGPAALAAPDAVKDYRKELGKVVARQKTWEKEKLAEEQRAATETLIAPWRERGGPDAPKVIDYDFSGFVDFYERVADFGREKGRLALSLAEANDEAAAAQLVESLAACLAEIAVLDREVREAKPLSRGIPDQGPGARRYAAWLWHDDLVAALSKIADPRALAYLAKKGWAAAEDADRKHRWCHARVALLDALTAPNAGLARAQATSKEARLRIAALGALARTEPGEATKAVLAKAAAEDPCFAVRAAAAEHLGEAKPGPAEGAPLFFGIPVTGERVLVLLDTSSPTVKPADAELMKERSFSEWRAVAEKDRNWLTQLGFAVFETASLLGALPPGARFDLLDLGDGDRIAALSPKGALPADEAGRRRASDFLGALVPGGYVSVVEGLWEAARRIGADPVSLAPPDVPEFDVVLLVSNGVPHGGPLLCGAAILDDARRRHRFLRVPVHMVRLDICEAPAEEVMKGIAELTGGRYVHRTKP